jgi:hypothetical protein
MTIRLDSLGGFFDALAHAHAIALASYTLPSGTVEAALAAAARRGAAVSVTLERTPFGDRSGRLAAANQAAVAALRAAGADARLSAPGSRSLHMTAAVVEGVGWLDARNWAGAGRDAVVRDSDSADVAVLERAIAGEPTADPHLATTKAGAQRLEAGVIAAAGDAPLAVATESFGAGAISAALFERARQGRPTRLLVAGREARARSPAGQAERKLLGRLARAGVEVRLGDPRRDANEKLAIAGSLGWVGSANASWAGPPEGDQREWGLASDEPPLVDGLRAAFDRDWAAARPLGG